MAAKKQTSTSPPSQPNDDGPETKPPVFVLTDEQAGFQAFAPTSTVQAKHVDEAFSYDGKEYPAGSYVVVHPDGSTCALDGAEFAASFKPA